MFWLKNCPRCSGDIYSEKDSFGSYVACVQCGFQKDIPEQIHEMVDIRVLFPSTGVEEEAGVGTQVGAVN